MKKLNTFLFAFAFATAAQADRFVLPAAQGWKATLIVDCSSGYCEGAATLTLSKGKLKQTFSSPDLRFDPEERHHPQSVTYEPPFVMEDFNFDGRIDLALSNGRHALCNYPSYDIYLQQRNGIFQHNQELSELTWRHIGLFKTDPKKKIIITHHKGGEEHYRIRGNRIESFYELYIEDSGKMEDETVVITERRLVNGKWISESRSYANIEEWRPPPKQNKKRQK